MGNTWHLPNFSSKTFFLSFSRMEQLKLSIVHDYEELQIGLVQEDDFYSSIDSITWVADTVFFRPALWVSSRGYGIENA